MSHCSSSIRRGVLLTPEKIFSHFHLYEGDATKENRRLLDDILLVYSPNHYYKQIYGLENFKE
jgi:hypothetical protein